jgi:hypothetical protein
MPYHQQNQLLNLNDLKFNFENQDQLWYNYNQNLEEKNFYFGLIFFFFIKNF